MKAKLVWMCAVAIAIAGVWSGCARAPEPGAAEGALGVTVSGTVSDGMGAPIPGASLTFVQNGVAIASAGSDVDGRWSVEIADGIYDVVVIPPEGTGFAHQTLFEQRIAADSELQIVLLAAPPTVRYEVHVVDASGAALEGLDVCFSGTTAGRCATSDSSGDARLDVPAGDGMLGIYHAAETDLPGLPASLSWTAQRSITEDTSETVVLATRAVTGLVVDGGGQPIAGTPVRVELAMGQDGGWIACGDAGITDAAGRFELSAVAGTGLVTATPDPASGLSEARVLVDAVGGDADVAITLLALRSYVAHLRDRDGTALSGLLVCVDGAIGPGCATTDELGTVAMEVPAGSSTRQIRWSSDGSWPQLPENLVIVGPITVTTDTEETITIENRMITVRLVDASGAPVAGGSVTVGLETADRDGRSVSAYDSATTDATGHAVLAAVPGVAQVSGSSEPSGGLALASIETAITEDLEVDLAIPPTFEYAVRFEDRHATPVPGMTVCVTHIGAGSRCAGTDETGEALFRAAAGEYAMTYDRDASGVGALDGIPELLREMRHSFTIVGDLRETIALENRVVTGVVVDAEGNPVANAGVTVLGAIVRDPDETFLGMWSDSGATDAAGHFELAALASTHGFVQISPDPSSGLGNQTLSGLTFTEDSSVAVLLQLATDAASSRVEAGGSITTDWEGDGATALDPVETVVTLPVEADVEIVEAPITEAAPSGWWFVAQQVNVIAPVASASEPLAIAITLDASRVPAGADETTLALFRDGVLVPACSGASGVASPDPCVASRAIDDGDVTITALTSQASAWNLGVPQVGDGDGDGLRDDLDACPNDAEDADGYQDDDGCPDLDDDRDGIPDATDACRLEPEDADGFEDDDGCPEAGPVLPDACPDFDRDGTITSRDQAMLARAMGSSIGGARYDAIVDLDHDGDVDVDDLRRILSRRGLRCDDPHVHR